MLTRESHINLSHA
jgi:hypothetical protein